MKIQFCEFWKIKAKEETIDAGLIRKLRNGEKSERIELNKGLKQRQD